MFRKIFFITIIASIATIIGCTTEQDIARENRGIARSIMREASYHLDTCAAALNAANTDEDVLKACIDYEAGVQSVKTQVSEFKTKNPSMNVSRNSIDGGTMKKYDVFAKRFDDAIAAAKAKFTAPASQEKLNGLKRIFE